MNILICEGDIYLAAYLHDTATSWGHEAHTAGVASHAFASLAEKLFDLLLLDLDTFGINLLPAFKQAAPAADIIAITSYNSRPLEKAVRRSGILFYMIKPFELRHLEVLVAHVANKRSQTNRAPDSFGPANKSA